MSTAWEVVERWSTWDRVEEAVLARVSTVDGAHAVALWLRDRPDRPVGAIVLVRPVTSASDS